MASSTHGFTNIHSIFSSRSTSTTKNHKNNNSNNKTLPVLHPNLPLLISHSSSAKNAPLSSNNRTWPHLTRSTNSEVSASQVKLEDDIDDEACELVNGSELRLGEGADNIRAYLLKAVKNNNGAGVLLLSDIFGFEDSATRDFAYLVACSGYNVLVPDLFRGNPWKKGQPRTEFELWLNKQPPERVAKDISTSTKWMVDEFVAAKMSRKLGLIGFCYGGGLLIETLARDKDCHFSTAVCFYGTRIDRSLASQIKIPVLFISGDNDPLCPVSVLREMGRSIEGSKVVVYNGRGHGFAHRPESPEEDEDAESSFTMMRNWLHNGLIAMN